MTTIDPDVELVARTIANADGYVNDGWTLCIPLAEVVLTELHKAGRLVSAAQAERMAWLERDATFWREQRNLAANVAATIADLDETAPALRQLLRAERERRRRAEDECDQLAARLADVRADAAEGGQR